METVLVIIDKLLPFLYVLAGGALTLLTPWATERAKRVNRKKDLKYELIRLISNFYSAEKNHFINMNMQTFLARRVMLLREIKMNSTLAPQEKEMAESIVQFFEQGEKEYLSRSTNNYEKVSEIEANVLSTVAEIQEHYSKDAYNKINKLVETMVDDANDHDKILLFKYVDMNLDQINEAGTQLNDKIMNAMTTKHSSFKTINKNINTLLK